VINTPTLKIEFTEESEMKEEPVENDYELKEKPVKK
jgi:hypothetical protein